MSDTASKRLADALEAVSYRGELGHQGLYRHECEAAAAAVLPVVRELQAEALEAAANDTTAATTSEEP